MAVVPSSVYLFCVVASRNQFHWTKALLQDLETVSDILEIA